MTKTQNPSTPPEGKSRYVLLDEDTVNRLIDAKRTGAQYRAFFFFSLVDPFGNRSVETSGAMARQRLGIGKSTYYEALAALQGQAFFDFEEGSLRVRSKVGSKSPEKLFEEKIVREIELPSEKSEPGPKNRTGVPEIGTRSENSEPLSPELPEHKLSGDFQYLSKKINTDHSDLKPERDPKKSKSNPKNQKPREVNSTPGFAVPTSDFISPPATTLGWDLFTAADDPAFFDYVLHHKIPRLPQQPASPQCVAESWIRKDGSLLYDEYQQWQTAQRRLAERVNETPLPPEPVTPPAADSLAALPTLVSSEIGNPSHPWCSNTGNGSQGALL
jgi:hypothetical protein